MKYLWEVMVQAEEQGLMEEQLRFKWQNDTALIRSCRFRS